MVPLPTVVFTVNKVHGAATYRRVHSEQSSLLLPRRCVAAARVAVYEQKYRQATELTEAVSRSCSDSVVNSLSARHLEACGLLHAEWESSISALKEQQLRNFRTVVRDGQVAGAALGNDEDEERGCGGDGEPPAPLQESFTIHLGTQMKQMHNLRLIAGDPVQLCDYSCQLPASDSWSVRNRTSSLYDHWARTQHSNNPRVQGYTYQAAPLQRNNELELSN
ncbi:Protein of unknown function DUF2362 [Trinorchestia longiramus]|nr:Protein of unknown function DUF2362 [Trinorchestia longiramus]